MRGLWGNHNGRAWLSWGLASGIVLLIVVLLGSTTTGAHLWALLRDPSGEHVQHLLQTTFLWLPLVIIGFMILHTLIPIPVEIIALAAGRILGPFWGFVSVWIGAMLGAYLGFWLARVYGHTVLSYLVAPHYLTSLYRGLQRLDTSMLLAIRLVPVFSFNVINYALGLSQMSWWHFTWTTGLGIIPMTALMVVFGAHLHDGQVLLVLALGALLLGGGGYWMYRRHHHAVGRPSVDCRGERSPASPAGKLP